MLTLSFQVRVRSNYKDLGQSCWSRHGGLIVFITQITELVFLSSLYLVLCGSLIEGLLPELLVPKRAWTAIIALIGLPALFIKRLSNIAWLNLVSVIALGIAIVLVLGYGISTTSHWDYTRIALWDTIGTPLALATIIFSYISHPVLPTIEANMKEPKRFNVMLLLAYVFVFVIKLVFAMLGYLAFSPNINEVITNSIPIRILRIAVNSLLLLNAFFSYPFVVITIIHCIEDFTNVESIHARFSDLSWFIFIRVVVSIITLLPGILIPHFALMISFISSLTGMFIAFIFPCVFHLYLSEDLKWYDKVLDWFVIVFGLIAGVTGLMASGIKLVKSFQ